MESSGEIKKFAVFQSTCNGGAIPGNTLPIFDSPVFFRCYLNQNSDEIPLIVHQSPRPCGVLVEEIPILSGKFPPPLYK